MLILDVGNQSYQFLKNNAILCRCNCAQCDNSLNKDQSLDRVKRHMVPIRGEWVNLAMGSILIWEHCDVFQCEFLAFYLAEMFKDTLCRKIISYIFLWKEVIWNNVDKAGNLQIINFVITIVGKELFENKTDNSTTFFSYFKYSL